MKNQIILFLSFIVFNLSGYCQNPSTISDLNAVFSRFHLVNLDSEAILNYANADQTFTIEFNGRQAVISVEHHDLRTHNYRLTARTPSGDIEIPRPVNTTFKGHVIGDVSSKVRLALNGKKVEGLIKVENIEYFIEPASNYSTKASSGEFVIYEQKDLINKKEIVCPLLNRISEGVSLLNTKLPRDQKKSGAFFRRIAYSSNDTFVSPGDRILNLSTDADIEYVKLFGFGKATYYGLINAISNINETLNVVEGLYEDSVQITFNIPYQGGWLVTDPFGSGCSTAECVLENFKDWWNTNRPSATFDERDAALLFTNKSVVNYNLAYHPAVCIYPSFSYGMLVGNFPFAGYGNYRYAAAAHELGHLFNAQHISGQILINNPDCYNSIQGPSDPNMPFYGSLRMCQFTINEINTHLQQNGCLAIE